jgi:hypothetical protein
MKTMKLHDLLPQSWRNRIEINRRIKALRSWQLGYLSGIADLKFPGLIPADQTLTGCKADKHFADGYEWALTNPVALSLPANKILTLKRLKQEYR